MNAGSTGFKARDFEARSLTFFFLISLGFPLLVGLLTYFELLHQPETLNDPALIPWVLLNLPVLIGPSGVAFIIAGLTEGKPGVKDLWGRFWNRSLKLKWLLVALFLLPGLRLIAGVYAQSVNHPPFPLLLPGTFMDALLFPLLLGVFSGVHEEFGWRGYALLRFQARWNALVSSLLLGAITALWHLPAFFIPGEPLFGRSFWEWLPWHMLIQIVGFTWIFNNTNGNVLAVVIFHAVSNVRLFAVDTSYYVVLLLAAILIVVIFGTDSFVRQKPAAETQVQEPAA